MKIRKAGKKDLKEVAELMINEYSKPPFKENEPIKNVLKSLKFYYNKAKINIAEEDKKIIGVVVFQIEQWWEGSVIIIQALAVNEKFQKKGVGKLLMKFVERYALNKNVKRIYFGTNKKSSAIKFYKKLGYAIIKRRVSIQNRSSSRRNRQEIERS